MIALSYILTAFVGVLLGASLSHLLRRRKTNAPHSAYKTIPAAVAYERYAAKVEGREPRLLDPKPAEQENPFFPSFRRAWRERLGLS